MVESPLFGHSVKLVCERDILRKKHLSFCGSSGTNLVRPSVNTSSSQLRGAREHPPKIEYVSEPLYDGKYDYA